MSTGRSALASATAVRSRLSFFSGFSRGVPTSASRSCACTRSTAGGVEAGTSGRAIRGGALGGGVSVTTGAGGTMATGVVGTAAATLPTSGRVARRSGRLLERASMLGTGCVRASGADPTMARPPSAIGIPRDTSAVDSGARSARTRRIPSSPSRATACSNSPRRPRSVSSRARSVWPKPGLPSFPPIGTAVSARIASTMPVPNNAAAKPWPTRVGRQPQRPARSGSRVKPYRTTSVQTTTAATTQAVALQNSAYP